MNVLAIVSTIEFQNRATIEAISRKYENINVVVKRNIKDYFKVKVCSEFVNISYFYTFFPERIRQKYQILELMEMMISFCFLYSKIRDNDVFLLTNTHVAYIVPLLRLKKKKIVSLFVDPYSLMNGFLTKKEEIILATRSDMLLCTSRNLADIYCRKHLGVNVVGEYWPNTVDISLWDFNKFSSISNSGEIVFGYAGNMNEITIDIDLVEMLVNEFSDFNFKFAGAINFKDEKKIKRMNDIFKYNNVEYIGMVPYHLIQNEVYSWDVCLMLDNIDELSGYVHHNKVYQYLSLGKIVVATKTHDDYINLSSEVYEAKTKDEFIEKCRHAILVARDKDRISNRVRLAKAESSDARAEEFMKLVHSNLSPNYLELQVDRN
ncbi:glycosyltransferase family protein [Vibrio metoecus]|uniref:Uncharacterized protein n=1 Tax=Vibrio metoecus TaxID=1481663 RepID=A0A271VQJ4_VIBMT|nr:hypothetical protein [Vibrio metoecus]KQB10528.1 hypothetical protein XV94_05670 [Vibrio metoecus]PAR20109.1 hypothetical protein CGU03_13415 [Vibrio metoecus]PAR23421.1 hypothetical protein CGU02_14275 [Vibrio metoecus]